MLTEMPPTAIWAIAGLALIILELVTTSFVLLFFGISALLVAGAKLAGLNSLPLELVAFAVIGLAGLLLFRRKFVESFRREPGYKGDERQSILLTSDLASGGQGSVEYQGTTWTAVNESGKNMKKGEKAVIAKIDGVKLILTK